jgi:hypothetical protein
LNILVVKIINFLELIVVKSIPNIIFTYVFIINIEISVILLNLIQLILLILLILHILHNFFFTKIPIRLSQDKIVNRIWNGAFSQSYQLTVLSLPQLKRICHTVRVELEG